MVVALAYGMGQCSAKQDAVDESHSSTPKVVPGPTKTVTKTETITRDTMPASCKEVLRLAREIDSNAGPLIDVSNQALDILEQAHEAITMGDGSRLNELRTHLYGLSGKTSKPAVNLQVDIAPEFDRQMRACAKTDAFKAR